MRVYLAGPDVFLPNPKSHAEGLKAVCAEFGLTGVFPLDTEISLEGLPKQEQARAIFDANVDLIRSSQAVLANMTPFRGPSMDVGTAWEMGFAHGLGLPIIGYTTDPRLYPERASQYLAQNVSYVIEGHEVAGHTQPTMLIEDFGLHDNLMLDCSAFSIHKSFREAVEFLARSGGKL